MELCWIFLRKSYKGKQREVKPKSTVTRVVKIYYLN